MSLTKRVLLYGMGAFYVFAGVNHFVNLEFYRPMMPPYLPRDVELIYLSGVAEITLGGAVLVAPVRRLAAWGIMLLLVAIFPANVHIALHDLPLGDAETGAGIWNWVRLPFQAVLIAWAWWYTRPEARR